MKKKVVISLSLLLLMTLLSGCKDEEKMDTAAELQGDSAGTECIQGEIASAADLQGEKATVTVVNDEEISYGSYYYEQGKKANLDWPQTDTCFVVPILQNPGADNVTVQWFTEGKGQSHSLLLYENGRDKAATRIISAKTQKLTRIRGGKTKDDCNNSSIEGNIYKHVAYVDGLPEYHGNTEERIAYKIISDEVESEVYSLSAAPTAGTPLRVLMTSDLQIKNMCAANIQKVYETVGLVDVILVDGDIAEVADRQYDWFYADNAFFRIMTGTACDDINGSTYKGAPFLQSCPVYTSIGNHDVMGIYDNSYGIDEQFSMPATREHARTRLALSSASYTDEQAERFIEDHSYNTISYEEIFELPKSEEGKEKYYLTSFGDVGLISLDASRIWRSSNVGQIGAYSEDPGSDEYRDLYGFGSFIFEPLSEDSPQIEFLRSAVESPEYKNSAIKICMLHSEAHSLGANQMPAFTDPVRSQIKDPVSGKNMVVYDYPIEKDYIHNLVEPILEKASTNMIFEAHSHIWNRFVTASGLNVLESSNVGNSYGGYLSGDSRKTLPSAFLASSPYSSVKASWNSDNYYSTGDPFGLDPVYPNISELPNGLPYLADDSITAFSVLDTGTQTVNSYYFDTKNKDSDVVLFDSFRID